MANATQGRAHGRASRTTAQGPQFPGPRPRSSSGSSSPRPSSSTASPTSSASTRGPTRSQGNPGKVYSRRRAMVEWGPTRMPACGLWGGDRAGGALERELSRDGSHYSISSGILPSLGARSNRPFIISPYDRRYRFARRRGILVSLHAVCPPLSSSHPISLSLRCFVSKLFLGALFVSGLLILCPGFFVFNGDYVDRGAWGLETLLLLLAWKVLLPNSVFLLRGNHESKYCTSVYGFEQEVMVKYKDQGPQVYRKFLRCFEDLPLASIIAGCVYTAHGGIFRGTIVVPSKRSKKGKRGHKYRANSTDDSTTMKLGSLDELLKARRTVLDPPWEGSNLIPGDVLWSDPSLEMGLSPNKERGIGLIWGPDITQQFLYTNNLKLIIRSHEGPDARDKRHDLLGMDNGYTIDHHVECGKLITLFSAPDYPQFQASEDRYNNFAAYIVLNPPDFATPVFHSFEAVKPRPAANPYYDFEEVIDSDEELNLDAMDNGTSSR